MTQRGKSKDESTNFILEIIKKDLKETFLSVENKFVLPPRSDKIYKTLKDELMSQHNEEIDDPFLIFF